MENNPINQNKDQAKPVIVDTNKAAEAAKVANTAPVKPDVKSGNA